METMHFTIAGEFLHVSDKPLPGQLGTLLYDREDFVREFADLARGVDRYLVDVRIERFLQHFFFVQ
jgi:hypothetical protein